MLEFKLPYEFGLAALYMAVIFVVVYFYTIRKKAEEYKYFRWGLYLKVIGGFCFGLVYMFYYGYGDTFAYYESAYILGNIFRDDPIYTIKLIFEVADYIRAEDFIYNNFLINYYRGSDTFTVVKIAGIISFFGGGAYFSTTTLFSCFAFMGQWKFYQVCIHRYPHLKFSLAIAHFLIPSVVFWGSGILKDSLVLGFIGFLIYGFDKIFLQRKWKLKYILMLFISLYFIYVIKSYVLLALTPAFIFWVFFNFNQKIKNKTIRVVIFPIVLILVSSLSVFSYVLIGSVDEQFRSDELFNKAYTFHINHYSEVAGDGTRSGYTLGGFNKTYFGMVRQVIPAVVVTYFRPFPWEIKNLVMALSALESLFLTFCTFFVLYKIKIKNIFEKITSDGFLMMLIVFALIFGFIVGFSSYNFGALARYKIPCLPFYFTVLLVLYEFRKYDIVRPKKNKYRNSI